jgi:hypothetical protein
VCLPAAAALSYPAVWDSSIVVAKYLEKLGAAVLKGKRCLDLSAGCGLVGEGWCFRLNLIATCACLAHGHLVCFCIDCLTGCLHGVVKSIMKLRVQVAVLDSTTACLL